MTGSSGSPLVTEEPLIELVETFKDHTDEITEVVKDNEDTTGGDEEKPEDRSEFSNHEEELEDADKVNPLKLAQVESVEEESSAYNLEKQESLDDAIIELDNRAPTPEPTDSDVSLLHDDDDDENRSRFTGRPTTEGFLHTYNNYDRSSLNSSCSSIYSSRSFLATSQGRPYSLYQGKSTFESLINSSAERVLEKIKTRQIDLEPLSMEGGLYRKSYPSSLPSAPLTPPLTMATKIRPRKLEPIKGLNSDSSPPRDDPFGGPSLTSHIGNIDK